MKTITGKIFSEMVLNGYRDLKNHYEKVNDLNVFPVPDGDTGTNIAATLTGGVNAMKDANFDSIGDVAEKLAGGMLLGARGNSGVITSASSCVRPSKGATSRGSILSTMGVNWI